MDTRAVTPPRVSSKGVPLTADENRMIEDSQRNPANPLQVTLVGKDGNKEIFSFNLPNGSGGSTKFYTKMLYTDIYNRPVDYKYSTLADAMGAQTSVASTTDWALSAVPQMVDARRNLIDAPVGAAASSVAKKTGWFGMGGARRKTRRGRKNRKSKSKSRKSRRS